MDKQLYIITIYKPTFFCLCSKKRMNLDIDMDLKVGDISAKLDVNGDWKLEKPKNALMSATEANIGGFHLHLF